MTVQISTGWQEHMNGLDRLKQFRALLSVCLHVSTEINLVEKADWELPESFGLAWLMANL